MKKQIALLAVILLTALEMQAPRNIPSGPANKPVITNTVVPSGGNNNTVVPVSGGNAVTRAQLETAVQANPGGAIEAVKKVLNDLGIPGSGTPDETVLNFIRG